MSTSSSLAGTSGPVQGGAAPVELFRALLDDAAVFPPGNVPMAAALRAHAAAKRSSDAPFLGPFVCSSSRLDELRSALPDDSGPLDLSLVVPAGAQELQPALALVTASPGLALSAVEVPAAATGVRPTLDVLDGLLPGGVLAYVELAFDGTLDGSVEAVAAAGHRVKLRTGGTVATAFPTADALGRGLVRCVRAQVPFKLTAGLHHAVRHRDAGTGFEHHGFLNVMAAVAAARDGGEVSDVVQVLEEQDPASLARLAAGWDSDRARLVRELFVSFGTCSTTDPLADLRALGLLPVVA